MKEDLKFEFFKVTKSNLMHALNPSLENSMRILKKELLLCAINIK